MRHSLHSHILYREQKVQSLRDRLTSRRLESAEVNGIEQQLSLAELALARYREAYALELSVFGNEPPDQDGGESEGNSGAPEKSKPRKKDGRAVIAGRPRRKTRARTAFLRRAPAKERL